jgi:hypothetical protein
VSNRLRAIQDLLGEPIDSRSCELLLALSLVPAVRGTRENGAASTAPL